MKPKEAIKFIWQLSSDMTMLDSYIKEDATTKAKPMSNAEYDKFREVVELLEKLERIENKDNKTWYCPYIEEEVNDYYCKDCSRYKDCEFRKKKRNFQKGAINVPNT